MEKNLAQERILAIVSAAKKLGISGSSLCKEAMLDRSTLRRWVSGEQEPTLSNFIKLESAFEKLKNK